MLFKEGSSERIAKTGFLTSAISFVLFFATELLRPGFVSRSFSVYLFLLSAILFGVWWSSTEPVSFTRRFVWWGIAFVFAVLGFVIVWNVTPGLEERPLLAILAFLSPFLLVSLSK